MAELKNIVFDFGGVLIDWNPHHLYDPYFGDTEKASWFIQNVCTGEWNGQMDKGKPFAQGVAELSAKFPEWEKEIRLYHTDWIKMIGDEIPGMYDLECELKDRGYGIFGLTNWSCETFCMVRHRRIFTILDGMVVSGEEHLLKPSPEIYRRLLERYSLRPEESLFIDDNMPNVIGARNVGMRSEQFRSAAQIRSLLGLV